MRCVHCRNIVELHSNFCAHCGSPIEQEVPIESTGSSDSETHDVSIAHLSNIAEAGYFADELFRHHQIDSTVDVENHFNALMGIWSDRYVIQVASNQAATSREFLQGMAQTHQIGEDDVEQTYEELPANYSHHDSGLEESHPYLSSTDSQTPEKEDQGINWIPFFLTLTAGSFIVWGVTQWDQNRQMNQQRIQNHSRRFWDDFSSPQRRWYQKLENGRTRELEFDPDSKQARIREFDGKAVLEESQYDLSRMMDR